MIQVSWDGEIVWKFNRTELVTEEDKEPTWMARQHHDWQREGSPVGYYVPGAVPQVITGAKAVRRISSRVLEVNPVTFEKVWEYSMPGSEQIRFFSQYASSAQRLPNGNTLITEGAGGRIFELTLEDEIVWEFVSPYFAVDPDRTIRIFRAYRVPYDWVPQLENPTETAVIPPPIEEFRVLSN